MTSKALNKRVTTMQRAALPTEAQLIQLLERQKRGEGTERDEALLAFVDGYVYRRLLEGLRAAIRSAAE